MGCGASALAEPVGAAVETVGAAVETIARTTRIEAAEAGATTDTKDMSRLTQSIKCERARRDGGGARRRRAAPDADGAASAILEEPYTQSRVVSFARPVAFDS